MQALKTFLPLLILSAAAIIATVFGGWIELSSFAVGLAKYTAAVTAAWYVDDFLVKQIDTRKTLNENPVAYALFLLGNLLVAGLCFSAS